MPASLRTLVVPLAHLTADTTPAWGRMTPQHVVEHLGLLAALSYGRVSAPGPPEAKWERRRAALASERPFPRNFASPAYGDTLPALRYASLDDARAKLARHVEAYEAHWAAEPDATHMHPYFGPLDRTGWAQFHDKHVRHHLEQFGLLSHLDAQPDA